MRGEVEEFVFSVIFVFHQNSLHAFLFLSKSSDSLYNISVKQFESRSGPTFCSACDLVGSKLFTKDISRWQSFEGTGL